MNLDIPLLQLLKLGSELGYSAPTLKVGYNWYFLHDLRVLYDLPLASSHRIGDLKMLISALHSKGKVLYSMLINLRADLSSGALLVFSPQMLTLPYSRLVQPGLIVFLVGGL